ncbi:MAG: hypothetical protein J07HN6_02418 [Halonotius sp. J07HN6]|jgi:hypothetical protein|nr:MAG: hypothetical protein J07HN6_02418 [Halonotius sp. J07HN6]
MSDGADETEDISDDSVLGALSLVGLISFCCIGIGAAAGTAALAGGTVGTTVAIGGAGTRGTLISALVTALTVVAVAFVVRWRQG